MSGKMGTAKTRVRAKPDGLTPVALRAKRPLIAPSRPSSSRLDRFEKSFWRRKVGCGRALQEMQEIQERPCGATGETIVQTALAAGFPKNQSVACEARHAPTGLRAGRAPCAHARPAPCVAFFVSLTVEGLSLRACTVSFVISKTHWQSCRRQPAPNRLQSAESAVSHSGSLCDSLCPLW